MWRLFSIPKIAITNVFMFRFNFRTKRVNNADKKKIMTEEKLITFFPITGGSFA